MVKYGIGYNTLSSLPNRKELVIVSPRTAAVKSFARDVSDAIAKEQNNLTLTSFLLDLLSLLRSPLEITSRNTIAECFTCCLVQNSYQFTLRHQSAMFVYRK